MENVKYIPGDLVKIKADNYIIPVDRHIWKVIGSRLHIMGDGEERYADLTDISSELPNISAINDDVIPIPLSKKILKKNGWHKDGGDAYLKFLLYYKKLNNCFYRIKYYENSKTFDFMQPNFGSNITIKSDMRYCHELQHLLFGLGLDNNLKI